MSRKSWQDVRTKRLASPAARDAYWRAERASQIEEVRRLREAAGLSQPQLAEKMASNPISYCAPGGGRRRADACDAQPRRCRSGR